MIHNPMVSGGSSGGAWKEVDRSYVAEHLGDSPANFLMAVFTPYFLNQPMIVPVSSVFAIGNIPNGLMSPCYSYDESLRIIYASTYPPAIGFARSEQGDNMILMMDLSETSGASDIIPEGWEIKYFVYEG